MSDSHTQSGAEGPPASGLSRAELENHWLPFTDNKTFKDDPRLVVKGEGVYLWNQRGERLLDGSAGLFTTALGHCRPEITEAVSAQPSA